MYKIKSIIHVFLLTMIFAVGYLFTGAAQAQEHSMQFNIIKNDVNDYGEESIQMHTEQGILSIYAINLSNELLDVFLAARAGNCMTITSPNPIEAYDGLYPLDQVNYVVINPCTVQKQDISTGCVLENNKVVVLSDLNTNPTYTYGKPGKPEIVLSADSGSNVFVGSQMFSGGGSTYVRFTNGNISYVAYNGTGNGWDYIGLLVYDKNKLIFHNSCQSYDLLHGISYDHINAPKDENGGFVGPPI